MKIDKYLIGVISGFWGLVAPLHSLIFCVVVAIAIDFITGNIASYQRAKRAGEKYYFQSTKVWKTCWKLGLSIVGMGFAWMLDVYILSPATTLTLNLANFFAAFIVGTEFWSFLENAAIISDHPIFRILRKHVKKEIHDKTGIDITYTNAIENDENE